VIYNYSCKTHIMYKDCITVPAYAQDHGGEKSSQGLS
jgi:hypothetical protein